MELRHTLEILTKDIQDIEKLVGNLQNSTRESGIELDLALSKLRNVYEVLTLIKADRLQELISPVPEKVQEPVPPVLEEPVVPEARAEVNNTGSPTPEAQLPSGTEPELEAPRSEAGEQEKEKQEQPKGKPILAEKFAAESSINENLAGQRRGGNEPRLVGKPIDSIHRNIGINDRFLIIRELFEGDADGFRELLQQLDDAGDYQKANDLLKERFPASKEHEGIEILAGLIKRRFATV